MDSKEKERANFLQKQPEKGHGLTTQPSARSKEQRTSLKHVYLRTACLYTLFFYLVSICV